MDQSLWTLSYQTSGIGIIPRLNNLDFLASRVEAFGLRMLHLWYAVKNSFIFLISSLWHFSTFGIWGGS